MALLPSSNTCCEPCDPATTTAVPGPPGADGAPGADGTDGVSAFTFVASESPDPQPVMPAEGGTVTINTTTSTSFLNVNQFINVAFWGYMKVAAIPSDTSLTLLNPEVTATSQYTENAPPGTSLPALSRITCAGIQGPSGTPGSSGAPSDATYITQTSSAGLSSEQALDGLTDGIMLKTAGGVVDTVAQGNGDGEVPFVDDAAGLTDTEALFATATGIESQSASTARTSLGLGTIATQDANAVAITGGTIEGTTVGASTAATVRGTDITATAKLFTVTTAIQSLLAATAVSPNAAKIRVVGNGGAVTLVATPTITAPSVDGQHLYIMGTDDTNTVAFQDEASLAGTGLALGAASRTLGLGDILHLMWDAATSLWYEVSFANN